MIYLLGGCFWKNKKLTWRVGVSARQGLSDPTGTVSGSGTGHLDTDSRGPVPDSEPRLWGLSRGPVVSEATTDKSMDTGPYLHVYEVIVYFTDKNSCWSFTSLRPPSLIRKGETNLYLLSCVTLFKQLSIKNNGKEKKEEHNSPVTNHLSSHLQLKTIKLRIDSWWVSIVK